MKGGAMALGLIGGTVALLLGLLGFTLGQLGSSAQGAGLLMVVSLLIPIAGLAGGGMVKSNASLGGILMVASGIGILAVLGINAFSLLPGIPLLLGGVLGLVAAGQSQQTVDKLTGLQSRTMPAGATVVAGGSQPDVPFGNPVAPSMRFCSNCGATVTPQTKFCGQCGAAVQAAMP